MGELSKNQRIKILRTDLGLDQNQFAEALGMKQGSISDVERAKAAVSPALINKMRTVFNANPEYINSGKGDKFLKGGPAYPQIDTNISTVHEIQTQYASLNTYIVPIKAFGGFLAGYSNKAYLDTLEKTSIPMVRGTSYMFEIDGFSMVSDDLSEDSYFPGNWVVCTELENLSWLQKNKIYVFATIEGLIIKQFNKIEDGKCYLKSLNQSPEYKVNPIPLKSIKKVFYVEMKMSKPR